MKKTILTILLLGVIVLGITGCGSSDTFDVGGVSDIKISKNDDVSLSIKDGTLKNTGITLVLTNDNDKLLRYDEEYKMEVKKDNEWHKINIDFYFNEPLWEVEQNKSEEIELNWEHGLGKLSKGEYRIIKEVYFENEIKQKFYISSEFTIE